MIISSNSEKSNSLIGQSASLPSSKARSAAEAGEKPLGNNTIFTPANDTEIEKRAFRRRRYDMLSLAREVTQDGFRVKKCSIYVGKDHSGNIREHVSLQRTKNGSRWHGLSVCGSVWTCPVCSSRIMNERKEQVLKALSAHRENKGVSVMVTLTFSHTRSDGLKDLISKFSKALSRMKASRKFKAIKENLTFIGSIRALEITHGSNGWHPHTHDIWLLKGAPSPDQLKEAETELFTLWYKYCGKYGLGQPSKEHGVRIDFRVDEDDPDSIGSYVTKWGSELTSSHTKSAKNKTSRTPWQILADLEVWNYPDSKLWQEYVEAMQGRAMLYWTKGLKAMFDIDELTDEQIAEGEDNKEVLETLVISKAEFYAICRQKKQAQVLDRFDISIQSAVEYISIIVRRDICQRKENKERHKNLEKAILASTEKHMREINFDQCYS